MEKSEKDEEILKMKNWFKKLNTSLVFNFE